MQQFFKNNEQWPGDVSKTSVFAKADDPANIIRYYGMQRLLTRVVCFFYDADEYEEDIERLN